MELGIPHFLPAAFYDLSRYGPSKIVEGAKIQEDEVITLSLPLISRTCRGRQLAQEFLAHFVLLKRSPSQACSSRARCAQSLYYIKLNLLRAIDGLAAGRDADPLFTLLQAVEMLDRDDFETASGNAKSGLNICEHCKIMFTEECSQKRAETWQSIPQWFNFAFGDEQDC